jgi:hypothetical protein
MRQGRFAEAAGRFLRVLEIAPGRNDTRDNLERDLRCSQGTP